MKILKKLAKYILRTEIQTFQIKIKDLDLEIKRERNINKDLKNHFIKKSTPVEFYKTLDKTQIAIGDLMILKSVFIRLEKTKEAALEKLKVFEENYNYMKENINVYPEKALLEMEDLKSQNKKWMEKLENELISLNTIVSKLNDIID